MERAIPDHGTRLLLMAAALVVIISAVHQAESIVALTLFSVFLSLLGAPQVLWLQQKGVPSFAAVLVVMAGVIASLFAIAAVVSISLSNVSDALPLFRTGLEAQAISLKHTLASRHIVVDEKVLLGYFNWPTMIALLVPLLEGLGSTLSNAALVLLTVVFILLETSQFPSKLRAILGEPLQDFSLVTGFMRDIGRYVVIKTMISVATGLVVWGWLTLLGVRFPVLWAFLAFLLNYIPNVGSTIAAIPAVLLTLVESGIGSAIVVTAGYLALNFILHYGIETGLMGRRLGLSMLVVFLSLIFWGSVLGLVGMVLCIPLTMGVKLACEHSQDTHWIAVLLGPEQLEIPLTP